MAGDVLTVIGDLVEDIVVWCGGPHTPGTDNPSTIVRTRGGSAANVAARAAGRVPVRFVGRVGSDPIGARLVRELRAAGVDARVQRGGRTGVVVVLVGPDGERTMFNDRGASADLRPVAASWLRSTGLLHVPGYGLDDVPARRAVVEATDIVRAAGGAVSVDVAAASLVRSLGVGEFDAMLDRVGAAYVFANADEAAALGWADQLPPPERIHVVKNRPDPAWIVGATGVLHEVPAEPVEAVRDTTGAGDAFAAGFLAAVLGGQPLDAACAAGHCRAVDVLASPGA